MLGPALVRRLGRSKASHAHETLAALGALRRLSAEGAAQLRRWLDLDTEAALRAISHLDSHGGLFLRTDVIAAFVREDRRRRRERLDKLDLTLVLKALKAADYPLAARQFRTLSDAFDRSCRGTFHPLLDQHEKWFKSADELMAEFALESGFQFRSEWR